MNSYDHTRSSSAGNSSAKYGDKSPVAATSPTHSGTDYRTTIQFLTSSATPPPSHDISGDVIMEEEPSASVPVSALLSPQDSPHRLAMSVPAHARYREDELTGMEGLMELASPEHKPLRPIVDHHNNTVHSAGSSASSSASASTFSVPPALNISSHGGDPRSANTLPPMQSHQRFHTYHSATTMAGSPASAATTLTPDSVPSVTPGGVRSFPATLDDSRTARRRSQSTDSPQARQNGAGLPHVLGNANIRDRSFTFTQRQRTSDTPLFPILLFRIVNDPKNESWIRWTENGTAFKFSSSDKLLAALQAAGLRAQNYHSVEKNLNDYRFNRLTDQRRKIPDTDGKLWWMFSHTMFHRDFPDQIVRIQRRRRTNPPTMSPQLPLIAPHPQMPTPPVPQQYVQQQQHHVQQHQQAYQVPPPHAAQHQNPQWM